MIPVLFVVTILVFSIIRFIPGEPARLILGEKATEEAVAALTEKLGLNEPLLTQYLLFLKQIFTLDFGNSFTYQMPVSELLASRFPVTLALTLMVTAKGIAGVPGFSFVVLLATLGSVGIPLEGLAFIAGVDRILDMARTALNVVGNALAVLVIAKWEHKFDRKKALADEREGLGKFDKTADQ